MPRSDAYDRHPEHTLVLAEAPAAVRVLVEGMKVAETRRGLRLREDRYPEVVYVPREDVRMSLLSRSSYTTHCPFKGDATHFDFRRSGHSIERVAWSYENPFDQMAAIRDHLAFYADRAETLPLEDGTRKERDDGNPRG